MNKSAPQLARIREADCIGCTICLDACPFDAIIGASKQMHVVIANECTGCQLCIAPCPMDCIELVPTANHTYSLEKAKNRVLARKKRLARTTLAPTQTVQDYVQAALARTQRKS